MLIYLALAVAVLAVSTSAPLVHSAHPAPALTVAALRVALAAAILLVASGPRLRVWSRLSGRDRLLIVLGGVFLGAHFGVWISSLYLTSTAASVALVATQPIFAALFGRWFLAETLSAREAVGIGLALTGCVVLAGGDLGRGHAFAGDMLAAAGAALAAAYLTVGRGLRARIELTPYLAMVNTVAAATLLAVAVSMHAPLGGYDGRVYAVIAACALVPSLVGHTLLNWSVRRVATHVVALAILGEPIGASLIQWMVHGEIPPRHAAAGGAIILAGIACAVARRPRAHSPKSRRPMQRTEARAPLDG